MCVLPSKNEPCLLFSSKQDGLSAIAIIFSMATLLVMPSKQHKHRDGVRALK